MIRQRLRGLTPAEVVVGLEKEGWSREWACFAVGHVEVRDNPAKLSGGALENQAIRGSLSTRRAMGIAIFFIGCLVTGVTLATAMSSGGMYIVAYGAVISGAATWIQATKRIRTYPDRPIPVFVPPKDRRSNDPSEY